MTRHPWEPRPAGSGPPPRRTSARLASALQARSYAFAPHHELKRHAHHRPAIVMVVAGGFEASVDARRYECATGEVVILPADLRHSERMGPRGVRSIVVMPEAESFERTGAGALPDLAVVQGPLARRLVWRMAVEWRTNDSAAELELQHHAEDLLHVLASADVDAERTPVPSGIRRAKELLEESLSRTPSLDEVAKEAGVSRAHLTRTFRRAVGCSVGVYLRRCRLDRAAQLLRETDRGIAEIALSMGFYDQSHFTSAFRRWVGSSPGAFRRIVSRPNEPRFQDDGGPIP